MIFTSTALHTSTKFTDFCNAINKVFGLVFATSTHKMKYRALLRLYGKQQALKGDARTKFEEDHWKEDFYTRDMTDTVLIDVVLSEEEDEEQQEDKEQQEDTGPTLKKFRGHILKVRKRQQNRRLDGLYTLYNELVSLAELEDVPLIQLSAMLLHRTSYLTHKDVAEFAADVVDLKPLHMKKQVSVESAAIDSRDREAALYKDEGNL